MTDYVTLTHYDVGRPAIHAFGRVWLVSGFIGQIFLQDVGKRVYLNGGTLQVENDAQFQKRTEGN